MQRLTGAEFLLSSKLGPVEGEKGKNLPKRGALKC